MDDDDTRQLAGGILGRDQIALHVTGAAGIGDVLRLKAGIALLDNCRPGAAGRQHRRDCSSRSP